MTFLRIIPQLKIAMKFYLVLHYKPYLYGAERLKNPKHPTQKPVKILEHIIKIASNENDIVLDMFMGVDSTGVACLNLNRRFIGIEIDKNYFDASVKRLSSRIESYL